MGDFVLKKFAILGLAGIIVVALAAMAGAHKPEGELFFVVQFPDNLAPTMDGDVSEWAVVPELPYTIANDRLYSPNKGIQDVGRGEMDPSDYNARYIVGWNNNLNKLYFMEEIFDDVHTTDREDAIRVWTDDDWEIYFNPDHSGPEDLNVDGEPINSFAFSLAVPPIEGLYHYVEPLADLAWYADGTDMIQYGWSFTGAQFGEGTYFYEVALTPLLSMPRDNPTLAASTVMDMEEGDILHITMINADIDAPKPASYNGFWSTSPGPGNEPSQDFVLAEVDDSIDFSGVSTAVEDISWGLIKSGFAE